MTIRPSKVRPGEKREPRVVQLMPELTERILAEGANQPGPNVFPDIKNLHRYFNRILHAAHLEKVNALREKLTAHSFRHTYGSLFAGVLPNSFLLQRALGDKDGRSTERYVHLTLQPHMVDLSNLIVGNRRDEPRKNT